MSAQETEDLDVRKKLGGLLIMSKRIKDHDVHHNVVSLARVCQRQQDHIEALEARIQQLESKLRH